MYLQEKVSIYEISKEWSQINFQPKWRVPVQPSGPSTYSVTHFCSLWAIKKVPYCTSDGRQMQMIFGPKSYALHFFCSETKNKFKSQIRRPHISFQDISFYLQNSEETYSIVVSLIHTYLYTYSNHNKYVYATYVRSLAIRIKKETWVGFFEHLGLS